MNLSNWIACASLCMAGLALYRSFRQDRKLAREVVRVDTDVVSHIPSTQYYGLKLSITNAGIPDIMVLRPKFSDVTELTSDLAFKTLRATLPYGEPSFPIMLKRGQQVDIYYPIAEVRTWIGNPGSIARFLASVRTTLGGYGSEYTPFLDLPMLLQKEDQQFVPPPLGEILQDRPT